MPKTKKQLAELSKRMLGENNIAKRPEVREKLRKAHKWNRGLTKETDPSVAMQAEKLRGRHNTKEQNEKIGNARRGKKQSDTTRKRNSETKKKLWKDPNFVAKQIKARHTFPNKPEKFLDSLLQKLFPNQWKYVGSGDFFVEGTNKNPDFININGQKKIIEMYGGYWHGEERTGRTKEEEEQQRIDLFAQHGYQTLVIWDYELEDIERMLEKLVLFCRG